MKKKHAARGIKYTFYYISEHHLFFIDFETSPPFVFNILGNVPVPPILYKYDGPPSSVRITTHDASGGVAVHDLTEDVRVCTPADFPCGLSRCDQLMSQPRFKTQPQWRVILRVKHTRQQCSTRKIPGVPGDLLRGGVFTLALFCAAVGVWA